MNISLLFWQMGLLSWLPLQPEQFIPATTKSSIKTIQGLPSLMLLSEKPVINTEEPDNTINEEVIIAGKGSKQPKLIDTPTLDVKTIVNTDQLTLNNQTTENLDKIRKTCFQAGPYIKINTVNAAIDWLENKYNNITVNIQEQEDKKLIGTWVYLPPFKTLEETKRINQYLDKLGIKDHHIVRGKLKNAISLGVYSIPTNAEIRVKELKSKGYNNVKIRKRYKENINYWLNIKMLVNQNSLITSFNKKFRNFTLISVTCESIVL
ncbi:MAG: hypothetical protein QM487_12135 [Candidatus Marithrix sp.]